MSKLNKFEIVFPFGADLSVNAECRGDQCAECGGVASDLHAVVWPTGGHDGGKDEHAPENAYVEIAFFGGCSCWASSFDLSNMLRGGFSKRTTCGDKAEVIALEKLRATIDALIAEREPVKH